MMTLRSVARASIVLQINCKFLFVLCCFDVWKCFGKSLLMWEKFFKTIKIVKGSEYVGEIK